MDRKAADFVCCLSTTQTTVSKAPCYPGEENSALRSERTSLGERQHGDTSLVELEVDGVKVSSINRGVSEHGAPYLEDVQVARPWRPRTVVSTEL